MKINYAAEQAVGIVKEIDNLGRLCVPKEIRRLFGIDKEVELVLTKEGVLMRNPRFKLTEKNDFND